jgi:hypothetical protein
MEPITMTTLVLVALGLDEARDFVKGVTKQAIGREITAGSLLGSIVGGAGRGLVEHLISKPAKQYVETPPNVQPKEVVA